MSDKLVKRIDTVFLPVRDLDDAIDWYTGVLGLTMRWKAEGYVCLNIGETPLTIFEKKDHAPGDDHPLFNFYSDQIDAVYKRLHAAEADLGAMETHGGLRHFRFRDPDGNPLEVCWWDENAND